MPSPTQTERNCIGKDHPYFTHYSICFMNSFTYTYKQFFLMIYHCHLHAHTVPITRWKGEGSVLIVIATGKCPFHPYSQWRSVASLTLRKASEASRTYFCFIFCKTGSTFLRLSEGITRRSEHPQDISGKATVLVVGDDLEVTSLQEVTWLLVTGLRDGVSHQPRQSPLTPETKIFPQEEAKGRRARVEFLCLFIACCMCSLVLISQMEVP